MQIAVAVRGGHRGARPLTEASAVFSAALGRERENVERFFTETGICQREFS